MPAGRTEHKRRLELLDKLKLSGKQPFKKIKRKRVLKRRWENVNLIK
jgi:hypothetical protein